MLRFKFLLLVLGALSLTSFDLTNAQGASAYYRQYYESSWTENPSAGYSFCRYFYYPSVQSPRYSYYYAIYNPAKPDYVYFYNPQKSVFVGRYDIKQKGFSSLKPEDRKATLKDIKEEAYSKPGPMPAIPDSTDGTEMEPPPTDLPKEINKEMK